MTGNQLERFARAHRQCSRADDAAARVRRRLTWRFEDDGSLAGSFRLPPLQGAVLLKALRVAAGDPEQPDKGEGRGTAGVSAETPPDAAPAPADPAGPGDPADPARCHVEDGAAVSITTAQMIGCSAALSWMVHGADAGGAVLNLGRRRRRANAAIRKAARERDQGRCQYPGCESRRVDLHHIQHWANGGPGLPAPDGSIGDVHDAEITPETIIPPWHGERLDLDYAIYTCLANEKVREDRQAGRDQAEEPARCCPHLGEPVELFVQPRHKYAPIQLPIPV